MIGNTPLKMFSVLWIALASMTACTDNPAPVAAVDDCVDSIQNTSVFGLETDSFTLIKGVVAKNQSLSQILQQYRVGSKEIFELAQASDTVFNVKGIRAGKPFTVFCTNDSLNKAKCFVYESSAVDYVVFDMRDSMRVYKGKRPMQVVQRTMQGTINSSLYQTMMDIGASPMLAVELSEVYAWTIDFYRIQKGDQFKVIYEENVVDNRVVGIRRILAADFEHGGENNLAFFFKNGDFEGYFDQDGENLKKAFLKAPLKFSRISSGFNRKRFHPVLKRYKAHLGTDYAAPRGTPILAVGDGTISEARYKKNNGNYVKMRHNSVYETQYLHMSKIASGIKPGVRVKQGDVIGYVGSTGLATGPHVCFRFWKNGEQVDHRRQKMPPADPVPTDMRAKFEENSKKFREQLLSEESGPV